NCGNVSVERADAMTLNEPSGGAAAVLSIFGLQLLPDPAAALSAWVQLLEPGGSAVVAFWPQEAEERGPFQRMRASLRSGGIPNRDWKPKLVPSAESAGGRIIADLPLCFEIAHQSRESAWLALTQLGPLRALAQKRGAAYIATLGEEFVAGLPEGAITHTP